MGRDRAAEALMRLRRRDRADEALARGADQKRQAEDAEFIEPGQRRHALFGGLAEADTGIEHDVAAGNAGPVGYRERSRKIVGDILHDIERGVGAVAVMHDDDRRMTLRQQGRHRGIALQAPDVVGDDGACIQRPADDGRFHAVDGYGDTEGNDLGEYRAQACQFFIGRDRLRAIGAGGLRADIDEVGALGRHAAGLRQCAVGCDKLSAIGK